MIKVIAEEDIERLLNGDVLISKESDMMYYYDEEIDLFVKVKENFVTDYYMDKEELIEELNYRINKRNVKMELVNDR